jgi:hypothetical protein
MRLNEDGGHCFLKCNYVKHYWLDLQLEHVLSKTVITAGGVRGPTRDAKLEGGRMPENYYLCLGAVECPKQAGQGRDGLVMR